MSVFTSEFSTNHSGSIICETSSPLSLLVLEAKTKLIPKKSSIFGYLGKETKNTDEHVIMKKIVNKDFLHSGSIGLI